MDNTIQSKTVLVLGASTNPSRYSNRAIVALRQKGYIVSAIGRSFGNSIQGVPILDSIESLDKDLIIHTVSMYLNEVNQAEYEGALLELKPKRVIFNPGAENFSLYQKLKKEGIEAINACTLVMLSIGNF